MQITALKWGLLPKLAALVIGMPLTVLAFYALVYGVLGKGTSLGLIIGILAAAGLSFHFIRPAKGPVIAIAGSLIIGFAVFFLSMFLMLSIYGI